MNPPKINRLRIGNFKAIRDSGPLKLTPLTVLIGNNGSGKSSVLEGLETLQTCVTENIDAALQMWRGIEHVRNKTRRMQIQTSPTGNRRSTKAILFELHGRYDGKAFKAFTAWNERGARNELFIEKETALVRGIQRVREGDIARCVGATDTRAIRLPGGKSLLNVDLGDYINNWQFLKLWPQVMGDPKPQKLSRGRVRLAKDGSNLAEFLKDILDARPSVFKEILELLQLVLPYAADLQPALTSEIERTVYLQMTEQHFKVPGWLLSTGTLRVLALLAVLRHPDPPPLLVVEEIENGLDPRTVHLLVEEIHAAVEEGKTQLILTTHSPYLLDLLPLSSIVLVDRADGEPRFTRPADSDEVRHWAKDFAPGQLYTMGRFKPGGQP